MLYISYWIFRLSAPIVNAFGQEGLQDWQRELLVLNEG